MPSPRSSQSKRSELNAFLSQHRQLDRETEHVLIVRYQAALAAGENRAARQLADRLIRAHLRFIVSRANAYRWAGVPLSDLVQEGCCGLETCLAKFDPDRGLRLCSYGVYWINAYIRRAVEDLVQHRPKSNKERRDLFSREQIKVVYLDEEAAHELPTEDPDAETRYSQLENSLELRGAVAPLLERLRPRERELVVERVMAEDPPILQAFAKKWGCTRERVRQIEVDALRKLRRYMSSQEELFT